MKLYLEVTPDELSLPLAVAESMAELSQITGTNRTTIRTSLFKTKNGLSKGYPRFIVIEVDDEE